MQKTKAVVTDLNLEGGLLALDGPGRSKLLLGGPPDNLKQIKVRTNIILPTPRKICFT